MLEQHGFPRARGPQDHHTLALEDRHIDAVEHHQRAEALVQVDQPDVGTAARRCRGTLRRGGIVRRWLAHWKMLPLPGQSMSKIRLSSMARKKFMTRITINEE